MMWYYGFPFMGLWMIFPILFWAAIIYFFIWLVRKLDGITLSSQKNDDPVEILKKRYAKGEISKKEFTEIKKDLDK